jgi:hypothetical protein
MGIAHGSATAPCHDLGRRKAIVLFSDATASIGYTAETDVAAAVER